MTAIVKYRKNAGSVFYISRMSTSWQNRTMSKVLLRYESDFSKRGPWWSYESTCIWHTHLPHSLSSCVTLQVLIVIFLVGDVLPDHVGTGTVWLRVPGEIKAVVWMVSERLCLFYLFLPFSEARSASHCHRLQTSYSSKSTCCLLFAQKSAMLILVNANRLTTQHSVVEIIDWW